MKIACFGNINANLPALEAVLADAKRREVDLFVHVGNLIGDGPDINETLTRLQQEKLTSILSQEDSRILKYKQKQTKVGTSKQPDKWMALKARYDTLSEEGRTFLQSLPAKLRLRLELKTILLLRQCPFPEAGPPPHGPDPLYAAFRKQTKSDIIIWTQGDRSAAWKMGPVWFLNTGSLVREMEPEQAYYTILQWKPGFFQVRHYNVSYHPGAVRPISDPLPQIHPFLTPDESSASPPEMIYDAEAHAVLPAVYRLLRACLGQKETLAHSYQVTRLALHLFDRLQPLHQYGATERYLLQCAALLHDIGWITGQEGHHKTAFNIITNTEVLPFLKRDRYIIAAVARYHRKSTPRSRHLYFATMAPADRRLVTILAGILRTADGLDRSHRSLVGEFDCLCTPAEIRLICNATAAENGEVSAALGKGTLLEQTFGRKLVIEWNHTPQLPPPRAQAE